MIPSPTAGIGYGPHDTPEYTVNKAGIAQPHRHAGLHQEFPPPLALIQPEVIAGAALTL